MSKNVHTRHCCVIHGCKYCDPDCPVADGSQQQDYTCESCGWDGIKSVEQVLDIVSSGAKVGEVTNIRICKLPYQEHPFVHGVRNGVDVWLLSDGSWTEVDGHPDADIPLRDGLKFE